MLGCVILRQGRMTRDRPHLTASMMTSIPNEPSSYGEKINTQKLPEGLTIHFFFRLRFKLISPQ